MLFYNENKHGYIVLFSSLVPLYLELSCYLSPIIIHLK